MLPSYVLHAPPPRCVRALPASPIWILECAFSIEKWLREGESARHGCDRGLILGGITML